MTNALSICQEPSNVESFIKLTPVVNVIKYFPWPLIKSPNKLEDLSLISFIIFASKVGAFVSHRQLMSSSSCLSPREAPLW